ncbi:MAG: insulinase family protein, partial [Xanthomonadaceae bacterium]|nr:insulinase family protein [Xanthomonadaceae bacterium]
AVIGERPDVETLLADYSGREQRSAGEEFESTPENIESRVVRFELANGAKVALLPKGTRGQRVRAELSMRTGSEKSLTGLDSIPTATASMLTRGSQNFSRQEINDRIDALQAGLEIGGSSTVTASIDTKRENLADVVDLLAEILKRPVFPESELDEFRSRGLTQIAQQSDDPAGVASRRLGRHVNPLPAGHPSYQPTFAESRQRLEALNVDQLKDFHARFYGFGPGTTLAFVGDFDADALREQLERLFADWSPQVEYQRIPNPHQKVPAKRMVEQLDDKANAILIATQSMPLIDTHADYPALQLAGYMLGGGFLSSRLGNRIRNEEGLSYAVGGNFNAGTHDENGAFFAFAAFAPENRARLEQVLREELDKAVESGFTEDELESARTGFLQQQILQRSDDARLAGLLATGLDLDRDLYFNAQREQRLAEVTVEEVNQAVARWLEPQALSVAIAGDFEAEEAASDEAVE